MYSGLTADIYQRQIRASQTMINQQQKIIDNIQEQRNAAMKNGNVYAKLQNQYKKQATDILNQLEIKEYDPNSEKVEKDALKAAKTRAKAIKEAKDAALKAEKDYFQLVQQMRTKTKESELKAFLSKTRLRKIGRKANQRDRHPAENRRRRAGGVAPSRERDAEQTDIGS